MSPTGRRFDQRMARQLSHESHLIIVCGHYEGVDHRVVDHLIDEEISIGDYVLTNGAIAAVVLVDAVVRLIPGVLGDEQSAARRQFSRRAAGGTAIHAPGGVSWLESSGNPAERKSRRNREVAKGTVAKTHARKSAGFVARLIVRASSRAQARDLDLLCFGHASRIV